MSNKLLRTLGLLSALAILSGGTCAPSDFYSSQYKEGYHEGYQRVSDIADHALTSEYVPAGKIVPQKKRSDFLTDGDYQLYLRGWHTGAEAAIEEHRADNYLQLHRGGSERIQKESEP